MQDKKFIGYSFALTGIFIFLFSQFIYNTTVNNSLYRLSQKRITKITDNNESKIMFVGDSSLGAALDEEYFSKISQIKTSNLSLTSTAHGTSATYNMIRHIISSSKNVKIIVIMHTPLALSEEFTLGGYCSTLNDLDSKAPLALGLLQNSFDCLYYKYGNFGAIKDAIKQKLNKSGIQTSIEATYKNNKKNITQEIDVGKFEKLRKLGKTKLKELKMIDDFLQDENITVLYIQGALHHNIAVQYKEAIKKQQEILKTLKNIIFIEQYLYPKSKNMGNTESHVDHSFKKGATEFYYNAIKNHIQVLEKKNAS